MRHWYILLVLVLVGAVPLNGQAQAISDYLILNDIGEYKLSKPEKSFPGFKPMGGPRTYEGAGVVSGAGHFDDHKDTSYKVMYLGGNGLPSPTVIVVQHAGADSDQWLLHEIERSFRYGDYEEDMQPYRFESIDGQYFFYSGLGGGGFRWISNSNMVVDISYTDLQRTKPVPIEVVKAYLAKHPSTVPAITIDDAHNKKWIKDEMERRLWICDKWFAAYEGKAADLKDTMYGTVKSFEVFLKYREKYYSVKAEADLNAIYAYKRKNDTTGLKAKLVELRQWWTDNKGKDITLP